MANKLDTTLNKLEKKLIKENDIDSINEIVELFNVNLQKKNIIRSAKLSEVQDKVVEQMMGRVTLEPDDFSNEELIKYHKIIQDTLDKTDTTMDKVKVPNIQINQQVNVDNLVFDSESRKRILGVVNEILNGNENMIEELTKESE